MGNGQQIVLVTGASGGIGKAIAETLAANGYYVFAAARSMSKLEAMRKDNIEPLSLDVTDADAIQAAVEHIASTKGRIDVLVNNAGYGLYGTVEGLPPEAVQRVFDVNVFGLGRMTQAVLPIMRRQNSGTIVNISSVVGKVSTPVLGWYASSKHAVEGMTDALRMEVNEFGIKAVLIEPGSIDTGFEDVAVGTLSQSNDPEAYQQMVADFRKMIRNGYDGAPGPDIVADTVLKAVESSNPRPRYAVGRDANMAIRMKRLVGDRLFDRVVASQY